MVINFCFNTKEVRPSRADAQEGLVIAYNGVQWEKVHWTKLSLMYNSAFDEALAQAWPYWMKLPKACE